MQRVRVMMWEWTATVNIWKDREIFICYDHKRGMEYLALEPNYSVKYPKLFSDPLWQPKAIKLKEFIHLLFNL
jgi:hypothetical protein